MAVKSETEKKAATDLEAKKKLEQASALGLAVRELEKTGVYQGDLEHPTALLEKAAEEGFHFERFLKLNVGDAVRGYFLGLSEGEMADKATGELKPVQWVHMELRKGLRIRMLGAYQMLRGLGYKQDGAPLVSKATGAELSCAVGSEIIIQRGADRNVDGGRRVIDYDVGIGPKGVVWKGAEDTQAKAGNGVQAPVAQSPQASAPPK